MHMRIIETGADKASVQVDFFIGCFIRKSFIKDFYKDAVFYKEGFGKAFTGINVAIVTERFHNFYLISIYIYIIQ